MSEQVTPTYRFGEKVVVSNVDLLQSDVAPLFSSQNSTRVIFDLENLRVCDIYGVEFFLQCQRLAEKNHIELLLFRPRALFKEIIKSAGLLHIFSIVDSLEEFDV